MTDDARRRAQERLCTKCGQHPIAAPSNVLCRICTEKIGRRLKRWAAQGYVDYDE